MARDQLPATGDTGWGDELNAAVNDLFDRADAGDKADSLVQSNLDDHAADTTAVHGIADTSDLLTGTDSTPTLTAAWRADIAGKTWTYTSPIDASTSTLGTTAYADQAATDQAALVKSYVVSTHDVRSTVQNLTGQSGALSIDLSKGWIVNVTYTDTVTSIGFTNIPTTLAYRVRLRMTCGVAGKTYVVPANWRGSALSRNSTVNNYDILIAEGEDGTNFDVIAEKNFTAAAAATVPGTPTTVAGTAGNGQVALTWTDPSTGGSAITNHKVETFQGATLVKTDTTGSATAAFTVTGLTNGTAYTFAVAAGNTVGYSSFSTASSAVTPVAAVPAAPTGVVATAGDGAALLTFTAPASNGATITTYTATSTPGSVTATSTGNPAPATMTVTGLTNGTAYTFAVTATNSAGTGSASSASNSVTPAAATGQTVPSALAFARLWTDVNSDADATHVGQLTGANLVQRLNRLANTHRFYSYAGPANQPLGNEAAVGGLTLAQRLLAVDPQMTVNSYVNGSYSTQATGPTNFDYGEAGLVETGVGAVTGKRLCLTISATNPGYNSKTSSYGDTILSNGTAGQGVGLTDTTIIVKLASSAVNNYIPSSTATISQSVSIHSYVSWVRLGHAGANSGEVCRVTAVTTGTATNGIGAGNVKLTVTRGFFGTTKSTYPVGDPVFVPVYIGKPGTTSAGENGVPDPANLVASSPTLRYCYNVEDADWAAWKATRVSASWGNTPAVLGGHNGIWFDVSDASFFNQTDFAQSGTARWNWASGQPATSKDMATFQLAKIANFRNSAVVGAAFAGLRYHVNNVGSTSASPATPSNSLIVPPAPPAWDSGSLEQWISSPTATSYTLDGGTSWANQMTQLFAGFQGNWPMVIWCKFNKNNPSNALIAQYQRYAYGSTLLAWTRAATRYVFGGPFGVQNDPPAYLYYNLGTPTVATPSGLTDAGLTTNVTGLYQRVFSGGLVLVNSTSTDVTGRAFGGQFYDVTNNSQTAGFDYTKPVTTGTIPANDAVVLVKPFSPVTAAPLTWMRGVWALRSLSSIATDGATAATGVTPATAVAALTSLNSEITTALATPGLAGFSMRLAACALYDDALGTTFNSAALDAGKALADSYGLRFVPRVMTGAYTPATVITNGNFYTDTTLSPSFQNVPVGWQTGVTATAGNPAYETFYTKLVKDLSTWCLKNGVGLIHLSWYSYNFAELHGQGTWTTGTGTPGTFNYGFTVNTWRDGHKRLIDIIAANVPAGISVEYAVSGTWPNAVTAWQTAVGQILDYAQSTLGTTGRVFVQANGWGGPTPPTVTAQTQSVMDALNAHTIPIGLQAAKAQDYDWDAAFATTTVGGAGSQLTTASARYVELYCASFAAGLAHLPNLKSQILAWQPARAGEA